MEGICVFEHYLKCFLDVDLRWSEMDFAEQEAAFIGMNEAEDAIRRQYPDARIDADLYLRIEHEQRNPLSFKEWALTDEGYW